MAFTWGNIAQVFKDTETHQRFQEEGYIVVDLLSSNELKAVQEVYHGFHPEPEPGFFTTTFNQDVGHRKAVMDSILEQVKRPIAEIFTDYNVHFCSFITKAPGPKSELILHQDMSLVDESKYNGINIWCPLVDLTTENGAIQLLPKSHRIFPSYRGASLPDIYDGMEKEVKSLMQSLYLKAGQAVIFDQSIMHYSPPNLSDEVRPVINTFVSHQDARIQIAWSHPEQMTGKLEIFQQAKDFMLNFQNFGHDIFQRPGIGESLGLEDYECQFVSRKLLEEKYGPVPYTKSIANPAESNQDKSNPTGFFRRILRKLKLG